jgi:hypothetical protein
MMGSPRRNVELIAGSGAGSGDYSKGEIERVVPAGMVMELGIEVEEPAVQRTEGTMCVLQVELTSSIELAGRKDAYGGHQTRRGDCLCVFCGFLQRRERASRSDGSCQWTSYSLRVEMIEESWRLRSRNRIAFV